MRHFHIKIGEDRYVVEAVIIICGKDLNICIGGGEQYHIGASALAVPNSSLENNNSKSSSVSVLCVTGHKEDEIARNMALELSRRYQCHVNLTIGMHIDHATSHDIQVLVGNCNKMLEFITDTIGWNDF